MLTVDTFEARLIRLFHVQQLIVSLFAEVDYGQDRFPLWAVEWGDSALPVLIIQAGVHGDEPSGIEAALRLLEKLAEGDVPLKRHRLLIIPCANPSGFAAGTRLNAAGQDINRQFHGDFTQESAAIRRFLASQSAAGLLELHTDPHVSGFYLFELRQDGEPSLGQEILDSLRQWEYPVEETPFFGGYRGQDGLYAPSMKELTEFQRRVPGLSLVEWGLLQGFPRTYTLEAPITDTIARSAEVHLAALFALFAALEGIRK